MLLSEIQPFVRQTVTAVLHTESGEDRITDTLLSTPDCRLILLTSGGGRFLIDGKSYTAAPYDCILFQSGTRYAWYPEEHGGISYIAVNFDYTQNFRHYRASFHPRRIDTPEEYSAFENIVFEDAVCLNAPLVLNDAVMLQDRLRMIAVEARLDNPFRDELLSSLLKSVIISIVRQYCEQDGGGRLELRQVIDFIQKHYWEPLTNDRIAAEFGYHPIYLSRKFRECTGLPLHAFLLRYRTDAAAELLRTQEINIARIVDLTGFSDIYQFSKCFKREMGTTPTEYRKRFRMTEKLK